MSEEMPVNPKCDFDSDPDPVWSYPCKDFEIEEMAWGSVGAWAACDPCSELIEAHDYRGLARRTLNMPGLPKDGIERALWTATIDMHSRFRVNRIGPREPIETSKKGTLN